MTDYEGMNGDQGRMVISLDFVIMKIIWKVHPGND